MKDINFFEGIKKNAPQKKESVTVRGGMIAIAIVFLILVGAYIYVMFSGMRLSQDLDNLQSQINQVTQQNEGMKDINTKKEKLTALQNYTKTIQTFEDNAAQYPVLNQEILDKISSAMPSDVKMVNFAYDSGKLQLTCKANDPLSPSAFAEALKKLPFIEEINYKGYTVAEEQKPTATAAPGTTSATQAPETVSKIQFTVECLFKGGQTS